MSNLKRFLSLALALMMVISMMPTTVFATGTDDTTPTEPAVEETAVPATTEATPEESTEASTEASTEPAVQADEDTTPNVSGTISDCLIDLDDPAETFITSEITGLNATESVVIKLYSGETQIATTTLLKSEYYVMDTLGVKIIITGDSSSWETVWAEGMPRADMAPDKVVLYVDGQEMNSAKVPMTKTNDELAVNWADVPGVNPAPVTVAEVATEAELVAALAAGGEIKLTADITTTAALVTSGVTATIDLNGKTLTIGAGDNKFNDATTLTIKNGNINIGGVAASGNAIFCLDEYEQTLVTTLTLDNVNLTGEDYSSAFGVFYIGPSSVLNVNGGQWTLSDDQARYADGSTSGGVFKADSGSAKLNITGATMNLHNVQKVATHVATTIENSTITITGDAEVSDKMEHGFNRSALTITNSTVTMENLIGRGITAENGAVSISENSTVTITNAQEATIDVRDGQSVTVDSTSTVTVDAAPTITSGTVTGVTVAKSYAVYIGETGYETLDAALDAAKAAGLTEVEITVLGDIKLSTNIKDFTKVTFTGTDREQTVDMNLGAAIDVNTELVFNDLTVSRLDSDWLYHYTYIRGGLTYNDCKMVGLFNVSVQDTDFIGCDFYNDDTFGNGNYSLWLYNCAEGVEVNITDCTFDVYERAIKMYGDGYNGAMTLNISGTEFTSRTADKTVIEMAYDNSTGVGAMNLNITDSTATGFGAPEHIGGEANAWFNVEGSNTDSTVTVDSKQVWPEITPVAQIGDVKYETLAEALEAVQDGETITLVEGATGDEASTEIDFTRDISFTITGKAPEYALPVITFQNATVTIKDAEILIPELDARQNATINVVDSIVHDAGGDGIVKSYYNGAINISGTSVVYTMQATTMGYITISDTAKLNATWQTNVYGNGMITVKDDATLATAALHLTGQDYSGRDNTDADRVGKPAAIVVDGANMIVGKVYSNNGADYSYNSGLGINIGTVDGKSAVLDVKNGAKVDIYMANGETANIGAGGTVNVDASSLTVSCRAENGTVTLVNNGTINVSGESAIAANVTGDGWVYMNGVTLDADTNLIGAKVRFASGTNTIDGSTIDDGFFQVGIGAYNGVDANVDTTNGVVVNVKNAKIGSKGSTYAGWVGTGFYDTDAEKAAAMTDAKYVLNIENSVAEFGYLHVSNDGELNVKGNAAEKVSYNNSEYSFYAGDFIINGTATFDATDVLALYTKVSCDNGTDKPGTLNIVNGTEYEAERHNGTIGGTNFTLYKTGVVNVAEGAELYIGEYTTIAADAVLNLGGTATALGTITNNGTINLTAVGATLTTPEAPVVNSTVDGYKVAYEGGAYKLEARAIKVTYADSTVEYFDDILEAVPYTTNYPKLEGATIKLLSDIEGAGIRMMENDMVLDLNGFTYTITAGTGSQGTNTSGFQIRPEVTTVATIKNGTIKVAEGAPVVWMFNNYATNFVVEDVTVDCTNMAYSYGESCYVHVSRSGDNTSFTGTTNVINFNSEVAGDAINVGGTMTIADTVTPGGIIELDEGAVLTAPEGLDVVTVDGYKVVYADGTYTSTKLVAKIGDEGYTSLADAFEAAEAGATVTIFAGEFTEGLTVNKAITVVGETDSEGNNLVNFTGKLSITADGATVKNLNFNNGTDTAGYINAKDVTIDGCSVVGGNGFRWCYTGGTVTFKNSTITGTTYGIHFDGNCDGNVVIDNCDITGWTSFASTIDKVTISDTEFLDGNYDQLRFYQNAELTNVTFNPEMTIDFGMDNVSADFTGCSVSDSSPLTDVIYLPDLVNMGIDVTVDGESIIVVAMIGENCYLSIDEAIEAAQAGDTIELVADAELSELVKISGKSFTLNGNGNSITGTGALWLLSGTYAINDVVFENMTYETGDAALEFTYATATVTDCTFTGNTAENCIAVDTNANSDGTSNVTVDGCTFTDNTCATAVINSAEGTTTVTDSAITGNTAGIAVIYSSSNSTISGNYFADNTLTGDKANKAAVLAGPYVAGEYTVNINGNAFTDADFPGAFVENWAEEYSATTAYDLNGNYWNGGEPNYGSSGDPEVTLNNYYTAYTYEDGVLTLSDEVEIIYVAEVGGVQYTSLQEAVNAAEAGDTITLIGEVSDEFIIVAEPLVIKTGDYTMDEAMIFCGKYEGSPLTTMATEDSIVIQQVTVSDADAGEALAYVDADNDGYKSETLQTLQDALDAAEAAGGTVKLTGDLTVNSIVVIPTGVTLDIEAHTLTVKSLIGVDGSKLIGAVDGDKSGALDGGGLLKVAKTNLILTENNDASIFPIWDPTAGVEAYRFSQIIVNTAESKGRGLEVNETEDYMRFQFKNQATSDLYNVLMKNNGGTELGFKVIARVEWIKTLNDGATVTEYHTFAYSDEMIQIAAGDYDYYFKLSGYSALDIDMDSLAVYAMLVTDSGAAAYSASWNANGIK